MHPSYVPIEPETLRGLYVDERLTMDQIAARLGCRAITIGRRLRQFGIPVRTRGRASKYLAPAWPWSAGGNISRRRSGKCRGGGTGYTRGPQKPLPARA